MAEDVPTFTTDALTSFIRAKNQGRKTPAQVYPTEPKFLIHVPKLEGDKNLVVANVNHGNSAILFPNVKAATFGYMQGASSLTIGRVEGSPQIVTTDGKGWIVVNAPDKYEAAKWLHYYHDRITENGGVITREILEDLVRYIQGFRVAYKETSEGLAIDTIIPDKGSVISFAFDLYTMQNANKEHRYESQPVIALPDDNCTGLYYKKMEAYEAIYIPGHFKVKYGNKDSAWTQTLEYHHGAMITMSPDGSIASIDPTNINSCYGFLNEGVTKEQIPEGADRTKYCRKIMKDDEAEPAASTIPRFSIRDVEQHLRDRHLQLLAIKSSDRKPPHLE